jgi:hypothetical protein
MVSLCLAAAFAAGACRALLGDFHPPAPPPLPAWATQEWVYDAAGIVAGETVHRCAECDLWIACTVVGDVTLRGYHPWRLRPGRWHGWRRPGVRHLAAVEDALRGGCVSAPDCAYLGSLSDYLGHWRYGLAGKRRVLVIGSQWGVIVCIPGDDD